MQSNLPRSRDHRRLVERIIALAEAYGATNVDAMGADLDVVVRIEYLSFQRAVRSAEERVRRRVARGTKLPPST